MSEWISVEDRSPPPQKACSYLICYSIEKGDVWRACKNKIKIAKWVEHRRDGKLIKHKWVAGGYPKHKEITHWMPLPESPKEKYGCD